MFDFPNAPTNGQLVQGAAGQIYAWDGAKWKAQMPPGPLSVNQGGTGVNNVAAAPWVELTGDVMTGLLTLSGDPTAAMHAATRQYVDSKSIAFPVTVPQGGTGAVTLPVTVPGGPGAPALTGTVLLGKGTSPIAPDTTTTSTIGSTVYPAANIQMVSGVDGAANTIQMYRATGTLANPGIMMNNLPLGLIQFGGYDGTWWWPSFAQISVFTTEDWTGTKHGTQMSFLITKTGTNSTSAGMTIEGTGTVRLNAAAPSIILNDSSGFNYNSILFRRNNGAADQHDWELFYSSAGDFQIRAVNDAYSAADTGLMIKRAASGVGIGEVSTNGTDFIARHLQVRPSSGSADLTLTGTGCGIYGFQAANGQGRWLMQLGDGSAETGGNVGSAFKIHRYADNGGYLGEVLSIARSDGRMDYSGSLFRIISPNDPFELQSNGGYPRVKHHLVGVRIWTAGPIPNATADFYIQDESAGRSGIIIAGGSGSCWNQSGTWNAISDIATKKDIEPYERGLADLVQLRPVAFKYNGEFGTTDDGEQRYGLIAQEVEPHFPEVINTLERDETEVLGVDSGRLIYAVINSLREIEGRLSALEAR